jgi:uncharacterized protein YukE
MSSPSQHEIQVATQALRDEANVWQAQSDMLQTVADKARDMTLGLIEAGVFILLVEAYNPLVHHVAARAGEAAQATARIATTLRHVANTYDAEDTAGEHRLRNLY